MGPATGTGHAKLILVGEHWVLDGALALAVAVPGWRTQVAVHGVAEPGVSVAIRWPDCLEHVDLALSHKMVELACAQADLHPATLEVASSVPVRRRLGSSAALAVALVRALAQAAGHVLDDQTLLARARQLEDCVHGTSSGLDPAAASADSGAVLFGQGEIVLRVPRVASALASAGWVLADTGGGVATSVAIERARACRTAMPEATYKRWRLTVADSAVRAAHALEIGDFEDLAASLALAGQALEPLDICTEPMATAMQALRDAGAAAAKPTGAGMGGVVVGLANSAACADRMAQAVAAAGFGVHRFSLAGHGVN